MEDLALSVAAVLIADACNIGLRPVTKSSVPALTRDRLSHVDQNYVRPETIRPANHRLIATQSPIALAAWWGGGLVASADGLRFVVPIATLNAGPNPRYFGLRRGATWLNAVNDRYAGLGGAIIPGTVRDSLHILDLVLNLEDDLRPPGGGDGHRLLLGPGLWPVWPVSPARVSVRSTHCRSRGHPVLAHRSARRLWTPQRRRALTDRPHVD